MSPATYSNETTRFFILLLIVNSVYKVWDPSWSYLKATALTDPNWLLPAFLLEFFLCIRCDSAGLGGLRALCSSFRPPGCWLKLNIHSEITVFICFQYLITVRVKESGAEWDPDGRAAVPHTLPWHRHGLAPSIPHTHICFLTFSRTPFSIYSRSSPRSLCISRSFSHSHFYLVPLPPPPPSSVVTFRTHSSMRSSGRVKHYNNSLTTQEINQSS